MKKIGLILVVFAFLVYFASAGQSQEVSPEVGDNAPDFSLVDASGNEIRLSDFKGKKNVVLVFYADHSSPYSIDQLVELQEHISEIIKLNSELIAIASAGNKYDVERTKSSLGITFPLIPKPNRKVAEDFGVEYNYTPSGGAAYGTIIIDKKGTIRFKSLDELHFRTSTSKIIKELQGIQ